MDQETALYLSYDHQDLMEELMDLHGQATEVWMHALADTSLDIYTYAINGYEWLSPDLYNRYMIPQAKRINELASEQGKLSWLHTCGKLKHIAEAGMYQQMGVDIVESLSSLPTGDIDDLAKTRADVGEDVATRGGINVELFYADDPGAVYKRAEEVVAAVSGYKHMIGDTNGSYPPYQWANIQALLDAVKATGRMYV
jgi:uroporphyrinogen-III decarboxylase